jgi:hypothetical protein
MSRLTQTPHTSMEIFLSPEYSEKSFILFCDAGLSYTAMVEQQDTTIFT